MMQYGENTNQLSNCFCYDIVREFSRMMIEQHDNCAIPHNSANNTRTSSHTLTNVTNVLKVYAVFCLSVCYQHRSALMFSKACKLKVQTLVWQHSALKGGWYVVGPGT